MPYFHDLVEGCNLLGSGGFETSPCGCRPGAGLPQGNSYMVRFVMMISQAEGKRVRGRLRLRPVLHFPSHRPR